MSQLTPTGIKRGYTQSIKLSRERHRFSSWDNKYTYHISVIDYLQLWNLNKKGEQFLKTKFLAAQVDLLSAVEPLFYQERFYQVMSKRIFQVCNSLFR